MQKEAIIHTVFTSDKEAFTDHVNDILAHDPDINHRLPITSQKIFEQMSDGIIFCKLINAAVPGKIPPISPEAINLNPSTAYHKIQNLNLAISSAKSIGCTVINIRPEFISEKREHIVLGLIWQIIKIHLSNQITIKKHPQILVLKRDDEEDEQVVKLGYEQILIRWLNYHIRKNGGAKTIKNLGTDLVDSVAYGHLLANLGFLNLTFWAIDTKQRAATLIHILSKNKIHTKIKAEDILSGNVRLHTILCVDIFNQKHGLQQKNIVQLPPQLETDESREIRVFKNWINSQGIQEVFVNYLLQDLKDGKILLKVIDKLRPNTVQWDKRFSNKLNSRIHCIQNCNYVLQICKKIGVKLIGIDGVDIVDGKQSLTLGLIWQICKIYWDERVGLYKDEDLLKWANSKVPKQHQVTSLKDSSISNCKFLLYIIQSIKPKTVNFSILKQGKTQSDQIANINYTIASARKLGAEVMSLWEHIKQVNPKYVGILLAELQYVEKMFKRMKI